MEEHAAKHKKIGNLRGVDRFCGFDIIHINPGCAYQAAVRERAIPPKAGWATGE